MEETKVVRTNGPGRPTDFVHNNSMPESVNFTLSPCEIEGKRTMHLDAFANHGKPYGHISISQAEALRDYLTNSLKWLKYQAEAK